MYSHPGIVDTHLLLRDVGLLKFYEETTSLMGNENLFKELIHHWNHVKQPFKNSPSLWYHSIVEEIFFIIGLSKRGEDFTQFLYLLPNIARESQLAYV